MQIKSLIIAIFLLSGLVSYGNEAVSLNKLNTKLVLPNIVVKGVNQELQLKITDLSLGKKLNQNDIKVLINDSAYVGQVIDGSVIIEYNFPSKETIKVSTGNFRDSVPVNPIPLWLSILPPLLAIMIALIIREVYSALFAGIWIGTGIIYYYKGASIF
ncbi:MAG: hypothetical protein P8I80_06290 [Bacteroidales bacterium]|nr:hypothetical protein [Bacteroidales bacterium]